MRRVCRETTIIDECVEEEKPRSKIPILGDRSRYKFQPVPPAATAGGLFVEERRFYRR